MQPFGVAGKQINPYYSWDSRKVGEMKVWIDYHQKYIETSNFKSNEE
jgi:hypothetical protein